MNLSLHFFRKDIRRFKPWIVAHCILCFLLVLVTTSVGLPAAAVASSVTLVMLVATSAVLLVVRGIQTDALVGDSVFWKTRPVTRRQLGVAKALYFCAVLLGPWLAANALVWLHSGLGLGQMAKAFAEMALYALALGLFAAAVSALTGKFQTAISLGFGLFLGLVVWGFLLEFLGDRFRFALAGTHEPGGRVSGAIVFFAIVAFLSGGAWMIQALTGRRNSALALLIGGVVVAPVAWRFWPVNLLKNETVDVPSVRLRVLTDNMQTTTQEDGQLLWSHFVLEGLPEHHLAVVSEMYGVYMGSGGAVHTRVEVDSVPQAQHPLMRKLYGFSTRHSLFLALKERFPEETLWFGRSQFRHRPNIPVKSRLLRERPKIGRFAGALKADLIEVRRVGDFAVEEGGIASVKACGSM